ncbi:MAG: sensor histidine kinase [Spirochaetia bacterium]
MLRVKPLTLAGLYALAGALWLATTDVIVGWLFSDPQSYMIAQLVKGSLYILTTAALVYWLVGRASGTLERKEVEDRLSVTERTLTALLDSMGEAVLFVDPEKRKITACNLAAERLFGYRKSELVGSGTKKIHVDSEHHRRFGAMSEQALEETGVFHSEYEMMRKDGSIISTSNTISLLHEDLGWKAGVVSIVTDISGHRNAEDRLQKALHEKEILLREVHHRVKNNLSIISSLLNLQADRIYSEEQAREAFNRSRDRIQSMALVHEKLYQSEDMDSVNMSDYMKSMIEHLLQSLVDRRHISIVYEFPEPRAEISLNRAVPCGLILNELVTNALKHAFHDRADGTIAIGLDRAGGEQYRLFVRDDGRGLPEGFDRETGLGFQIVHALAEQLEGRLCVQDRPADDRGAEFDVVFPG